jgi:AcrR family transcriptional regulator
MATKRSVRTPESASLRAWDEIRASTSKEAKVMVAAVHQVARAGIDRLTVSALLADAGVARGTVYAHFGDASGVAATVWSRLGEQWLEDVLRNAGPVLPGRHDRIFFECLALTRREPQLAEVVRPDMEAWWNSVELGGETAQLRAVWTLAALLGTEILRPVMTNVPFAERLAVLARDYDPDTSRGGRPPAAAPRELPMAVISPFRESDDPITDRLVRGAVEVVASAGYENASVLRIARSAKLTPGAVAPRFDAIIDLHALTLETASREVVEMNMAQVLPWLDRVSAADLNGLLVLPALDEIRRTWRAYRNEMAIASLGNPKIARMVSRATARANDALAEHARLVAGPAAMEPAVVFNEVFAVGLSILDDVGVPLAGVDHRLMVRHFYAELIGDPDTRP